MPTQYFSLPTITNADKIDGATQFTELANAVDDALHVVEVGAEYELQPATSTMLGGIKVGANLTIAQDGTLAASGGTALAPATADTLGGIKVGNGLTIDADGVLSLDVDAVKNLFATGTTWGDISTNGFVHK